MTRSTFAILLSFAIPFGCWAQTAPTREQALAAMKKAATFYVEKVSPHGGYHYSYAEDLSYGRSEHGEGMSQIEVQREATPIVGMTFLEAFDATGDRYYLEAARKAAASLVAGQLCTGGWDYLIEFDPARRKRYPYRTEHDCASSTVPATPPTTLDDNVSQAATRLLMRVDKALAFKDAAIHEAALYALNQLMRAQYPNGAWPQRYTKFPDPAKHPVKQASYPDTWSRKWPGEIYKEHYTFNDNSISDDIDMMLEAARIYDDKRYLDSALKGGGFLLLAQMPDPQPAWAQQYDVDMHPAWARLFEPPSVTGGESQGIVRTLMVLYRETGDRKYLDPVPRALGWLEKSVLPETANPSEHRRRLRGAPALARFYELQTNRPLYITKGTQIRAAQLGSARIDGYELSYDDGSVITHYGVLTSGADLPAIRKEYDRVRAADPSKLRRPDKLHGLSPWSSGDRSPIDRKVTGEAVRKMVDGMDSRGAWLEDGIIGKADQIVSVFAARPMVLTINGRPIEINENDTIQLFQGTQPPRTRIIRSATFTRNLLTLAAYVNKGR
ncbi:MAG: pectate lyase [Bryobacteraceae bacterium]